MAVKRRATKRLSEPETKGMPKAAPEVKTVAEGMLLEKPEAKMAEGKWASLGWALLLVGGLAHMLPEQMAPLLKFSMYGVSLQMAVGAVSVIMALYFLLGE